MTSIGNKVPRGQERCDQVVGKIWVEETCVVCWDSPSELTYRPCRHRCVCERCHRLMKRSQCVLCLQTIQQVGIRGKGNAVKKRADTTSGVPIASNVGVGTTRDEDEILTFTRLSSSSESPIVLPAMNDFWSFLSEILELFWGSCSGSRSQPQSTPRFQG